MKKILFAVVVGVSFSALMLSCGGSSSDVSHPPTDDTMLPNNLYCGDYFALGECIARYCANEDDECIGLDIFDGPFLAAVEKGCADEDDIAVWEEYCNVPEE